MKICTIRSVDLCELLYIHTENFIEIDYEPRQYVLTSYKLLKMVKIADYLAAYSCYNIFPYLSLISASTDFDEISGMYI